MIEERRKRRWVPKHLDSGLWKDIPFQNKTRIRAEVPEFEEGVAYSQRELDLMAEKYLLMDPDSPKVLDSMRYGQLVRREVYSEVGYPTVEEPGMYNRTAPDGRRFRQEPEDRPNGEAYYV